MVTRYMDYTDPDLPYAYDLRKNRIFGKNKNNYIEELGIKQLPTIGNIYLLDVFLSANNVVEPHYHSNASELIYCITGETVVSMINLHTNELKNIRIQPQQVVTIPQGWWHYFTATVDKIHVLTMYDTPELYTVWGSDILRLTPPEVFAHTYWLDKDQIQQALAPIEDTVMIGPPANCHKNSNSHNHTAAHYQSPYRANWHSTRGMEPPSNGTIRGKVKRCSE